MTTLSNLVQYTNEATSQKAARHFCVHERPLHWTRTASHQAAVSISAHSASVVSQCHASFSFVSGETALTEIKGIIHEESWENLNTSGIWKWA